MPNFDREMESIISNLKQQGVKPKLLLHSCCAPCSSACMERLKDAFDLTVFYYNPNVNSEEEYNKRASEQQRLCTVFSVPCVVVPYDAREFYSSVLGYEKEPEGGLRCGICFNLRLNKTALYAKANGYEYFTTTLTLSPLKNAERINAIGKDIENELSVKFLPCDFKKRGGYLRSIELSKLYGLYRQNYCGCVYSVR